MRNIDILKQFLKDTASQIRSAKFQFKQAQKNEGTSASITFGLQHQLRKLQYEYRHHHIAYCELRGRTRSQIEPKIREHNEPNETYIKQIKEKYAWTPEEIKAYEERKNAKALYTCEA